MGEQRCFVFWNSPRGREQTNTSATTLFEAAFNALHSIREGHAPKPGPETVLEVYLFPDGRTFYVRVDQILQRFGREHQEFFSVRTCPECREEVVKAELLAHLVANHGYSRDRARDYVAWIS